MRDLKMIKGRVQLLLIFMEEVSHFRMIEISRLRSWRKVSCLRREIMLSYQSKVSLRRITY